MLISFRNFSTVTLAARKLQDLATFEPSAGDPEKPVRIVCLTDFLEDLDEIQTTKFRSFVTMLEQSLGLQAEPVSLSGLWLNTPPEEAQGAEMDDYMYLVCACAISSRKTRPH